MIETQHVNRQHVATGIAVGAGVALVCLAVLWLVLAVGVGLAG